MRKYVFGIILGIIGTVTVQHIYKTNAKLQSVINTAAREFGLDNPNESGRAMNFFDKCSLIWQRIRR
jgi:hypothetical protein